MLLYKIFTWHVFLIPLSVKFIVLTDENSHVVFLFISPNGDDMT